MTNDKYYNTEEELEEETYSYIIEGLKSYAALSNDENGEYCISLLEFLNYKHDMPKDLYKKLIEEASHWLTFFTNNFDIIDREETYTQRWRELEYKYES